MENNKLVRRSFQSSLNRGFKRPMSAQSGIYSRLRVSPMVYLTSKQRPQPKQQQPAPVTSSSVPSSLPPPLSSLLNPTGGKVEELKNEASAKIAKQDSSYVSFLKLEQFGRLGNQMFQIAAVLGFAELNPNYKPGFIAWKYNCFLKKPLPSLPPNWKSNLTFQLYDEPHFHWKQIEIDRKETDSNSLNLSGYFQSVKYFENCKQKIYDTFELNSKYKSYIDRLLLKKHDLLSVTHKMIGIHVRKGDYVNGTYHIDLQRDYYAKAWNRLLQELKNKTDLPLAILICSDDMDWCRSNLKDIFTGCTKIVWSENEPDIIDMYLLAECEHLIIANSSFSWWAAFLSQKNHPNSIVIAPKECFHPDRKISVADLFPESWIRL
jgi:hypothetical protein